MGANVQLVVDAARRAAADGAPVVLVGHSFGCRVVAELLTSEAVPKPSGVQRLPSNIITRRCGPRIISALRPFAAQALYR